MPNKFTHTIWEPCLRIHRQSMHFCWKFARWRASSVSGIRSPLPSQFWRGLDRWISEKKLRRRRNSQPTQSFIVLHWLIFRVRMQGCYLEILYRLRIWDLIFGNSPSLALALQLARRRRSPATRMSKLKPPRIFLTRRGVLGTQVSVSMMVDSHFTWFWPWYEGRPFPSKSSEWVSY